MSPFVMVIFGATGDLARHKLFPALFSLYVKKLLPETFFIIGFSRRDLSYEAFRAYLTKEIPVSATQKELWEKFMQNVYYQQGMFNEVGGYEKLIEKLTGFDMQIGACITRLFYLATPPDNYTFILDHLKKTKLSEGCGPLFDQATQGKQDISKWTRVAIEKPFGKDLETARSLDRMLAEIFEEKQIYRVDHYLGKETVQNMIAFRFANGIFEPVWNNTYIEQVQITFGEKRGVSGRGMFFDGVGILRDVAQNHLLQLVAAVAMEQPKGFSKESVRDARVKAIQSIRCIDPEKVDESVVRGQYDGYTEEEDVSKDSDTETFMAMKLFVDTKRFEHVPFYLRAGKKMPADVVEIKIVFIQTCHLLFKEYGCPEIGNVLTIRIQPDEGIGLQVIAKKPGTKLALGTVDMKFSYAEEFGEKGADAYEKLLLDILAQDQMLFNRSDELESSWTFITNILKGWEKNGAKMQIYKDSEWGPKSAEELLKKDGKKWL